MAAYPAAAAPGPAAPAVGPAAAGPRTAADSSDWARPAASSETASGCAETSAWDLRCCRTDSAGPAES